MKPLEAGDPGRIGPYSVLGMLGSGEIGKVYLGCSASGHLAAVRQVRPELAADSQFRARLREQVAQAKAVAGPFIAAVVNADTETSAPWVATAYIAGVSLDSAVTNHGPLPEPTLRTLAVGLAEAISAIRRHSTVHHRLKPSNVLLAQDGPYITDSGSNI